jgi:hypothetical protein
MMRGQWAVLLLIMGALSASGAPIKPLDARGGDPRAAWRRLGPEAKEAFVLGLMAGIEEGTEVIGKEPPTRGAGEHFVADVVETLDAFFEDGAHAYTPWRAAAVGALRENGMDSALLTTTAAVDSLRDASRAAWLADHPKAARRARRRAAGAAHLPVAAEPGPSGSGCLQFQEWLLAEFQLAEGMGDSALMEKMDSGEVELANGTVTIVAGETREHREHLFHDVFFHFVGRDVGSTADSCTAVVVLVDGIPTRLDGLPQSVRNRSRRRRRN